MHKNIARKCNLNTRVYFPFISRLCLMHCITVLIIEKTKKGAGASIVGTVVKLLKFQMAVDENPIAFKVSQLQL